MLVPYGHRCLEYGGGHCAMRTAVIFISISRLIRITSSSAIMLDAREGGEQKKEKEFNIGFQLIRVHRLLAY